MFSSARLDTSSEGSSDFFSPISASFFKTTSSNKVCASSLLPTSHDTSWIGARMSPIRSFDQEEIDEDDDEYREATSRYQLALHQSLMASASVANERTTLLSKPSTSQLFVKNHNSINPSTAIHPLWSPARNGPENTILLDAQSRGGEPRCSWENGRTRHVGILLCLFSGLHWVISLVISLSQGRMGINWGYHQSDLISSGLSGTWKTAWVSPQVLFTYGGAITTTRRILSLSDCWRIPLSWTCATSLWEWFFGVCAWILIGNSTGQGILPHWSTHIGVFVASAVCGQLSFVAWQFANPYLLVGCLLWGTVGVLTHQASLQQQPQLFGMAAFLVFWSWVVQPYNSVWGMTLAAFWGWALAESEKPSKKNLWEGCTTKGGIATAFCISLIVAPVLYIAFTDK
ncbi:predicted protein [Phaeodactylum tricornutum CCAP 1055/1]|jgi:hypothetical protein|uniref:Uncharacterized protein n=1 Tax=Phaeodactylum tricornutum (strain CCAP 1055/1) TaxID=556484 RepID=B7FWX3_PHATC|nr:predicted protein [Phaeodactylum tricornutum CCAP 1055/1]EEC49278.1 predicted protein [Phaeodactylum tricornutum CCAP 1055/1]|eukprot:XP_002179455.1 predicted protein [Phaeodactylum tricornutum CCAP 1055/1]